MGHNWKEYIDESIRVLRYNGEIIISESTDRYDIIKNILMNWDYTLKQSAMKIPIDGFICILLMIRCKKVL
jgi:hypothetical protein